MPLRNRYRIIQRLGAGGFGRTFLAEDVDKLDERCVVKQFLPQAQGSWAIQKATELFQQEARRLQQLGEHSQIPTLYAYFEEDKRLYLVQQSIEGENLLQELAQGIFTEEKIRELLLDLLPVLKFVHEHNVIHRDIKPDNIIRRRSDGKLVLIDFGVAKQLTVTTINHPGTHIGTLGFAPIEQMQSGEAYPSSDLYSLGVTCFKLLTRNSPHSLFVHNGYEWVKSWRQYLTSPVSEQLDYVLDKLLQKDMQQRYQSPDEVLQDLNSQRSSPSVNQPLTQQPSAEVSSEASSVAVKPVLRQRNKLLAVVVGGVFLLLGFGGYWYFNYGKERTLTGHSSEVNAIAISPDSKIIASSSDDKTVKLWNLNWGKGLRTLKGHSDWVYAVAISPNGKTVVSGGKDNTIKVWDMKMGEEIRSLKGHTGFINSVAISPDNQIIASASYDKTIKLWNMKTGQLQGTLTGHSNHVLSVAFSLNSQIIVSSSADKTIKVWNLKTGRQVRTLTGHLGDINSISLSPNGQAIASVSDDKTIRVWNLNTGREVRALIGHLGDINSVAFSPDGKTLASGSDDKTIKLWNLTTGEELATLRGHSGAVYAIAFTPNKKFLVSGSEDKTIKIWQVP